VANRFLDSISSPAQQSPSPVGESKPNRFLSSIEGTEFAPPSEGFLKGTARTLAQLPLGALQRYTYPADVIKLLTSGASQEVLAQLQEEEPELKNGIAEQARQKAESYLPTQGLAEQLIEEKTGLPLTPKNKLQKLIRLGSTAAAFRPKAPLTAGVTAPAVAGGLHAAGVPESVAEPVGLLASGVAPSPSVSKVVKPSGLPARRFEKVTKPTKVSPERFEKINETVEQDFRKIADKILEKNRTYSALKEDTQFKEKIGDLFEKVEDLAKEVPGKLHTDDLRQAFKKRFRGRETKGISPDEFERAYTKEIRDINNAIPHEEMTALQGVEQFRKNNKSLRELFEPGKSSAYNRAKREALLEYNRAIEDVFKKKYPDTEFTDLFEFTNNRWAEINDIEQIDKFFGDVFKGKIDFNRAKQILNKDKEHVARPFKRILGEEGFKDIKGLMNDLMSQEKAYGYIKKAESAGFGSLAKSVGAYLVHPSLAKLKITGEIAKNLWKSLLDKPQLSVTWKNGIDNFKKGNYKEAEKDFAKLEKESK
jgi:hypothetical protein